jgi:hypothetical protein
VSCLIGEGHPDNVASWIFYAQHYLKRATITKGLFCSSDFLFQSFDMKDLDESDVILNIKLIKGGNWITIKQSHYVQKGFEPFWLYVIPRF